MFSKAPSIWLLGIPTRYGLVPEVLEQDPDPSKLANNGYVSVYPQGATGRDFEFLVLRSFPSRRLRRQRRKFSISVPFVGEPWNFRLLCWLSQFLWVLSLFGRLRPLALFFAVFLSQLFVI